MSKFHLPVICLTIALSLLPLTSYSQGTVYITDVLYVPMRSGQGNEYRIINKALKSGTALKQMEVNAEGTWARVVTDAGVEGWVPTQYLTNESTAQIKLDRLQTRLTKLEKENATLKTENSALTNNNQEISTKASNASQNSQKLAAELERIKQISANAIDLDKSYQELLEKHQITQTQRDSLLAENENLKSDKTLSFMFYGAGILILGMLMAVILPALKPKKRYSDWA